MRSRRPADLPAADEEKKLPRSLPSVGQSIFLFSSAGTWRVLRVVAVFRFLYHRKNNVVKTDKTDDAKKTPITMAANWALSIIRL